MARISDVFSGRSGEGLRLARFVSFEAVRAGARRLDGPSYQTAISTDNRTAVKESSDVVVDTHALFGLRTPFGAAPRFLFSAQKKSARMGACH
jgi:hypothetical protein